MAGEDGHPPGIEGVVDDPWRFLAEYVRGGSK